MGNALALPAVAAYNEAAMGEKAAFIAAAFGGVTAAEGLARLRLQLDLDLGLDAFVPTGDDREKLAAAAMRSGQVRMNPRLATIDDLRVLVQAMRQPTGNQAPRLPL